MRQHGFDHVVAEGFLQMDVALRHALGDGAAHIVIVDDLIQVIGGRGRFFQWDEEIDVDQHALFTFLFKLVHAYIDLHFLVTQEKAAAVGELWVEQERIHISKPVVLQVKNLGCSGCDKHHIAL